MTAAGRAAAPVMALLAPALAATASLGALPPQPEPGPAARADIPPGYLAAYTQAAAGCPGLGWPLLAAVGKLTDDHGRQPSPPGRPPAGQGAHEQTPGGRAGAAARRLCRLGAAGDPHAALLAWRCGNTGPACQLAAAGWAAQVLDWARRYAQGAPGPVPAAASADPAATAAVRAALAQLGTPYVWGGAGPGGFDCSGLVRWAYARAGLDLPRVAQDQYDAGPPLPPGAPPAPGDLVFFGAGPGQVEHVGIALGDGRMLDAPHPGAVVRIEPIAGFNPPYVGATRPTAGPAGAGR